MANDSTQLNPQELQDELNSLLEIRHQIYINGQQDTTQDPFEEIYNALADTILSCTRTFMGLRNLELMIREDLEDATQDSREL